MLFKKKKKDKAAEDETEDKAAEETAEAKTEEAAEEGKAEEGDGEGAPKKKKKSKKTLLILIVLLVLVLIGGAGAWYFVIHKPEQQDASAGVTSRKGGTGPAYYTLPEFLVNLNTTSKQASFLKMTVVLQMESEEDAKKVEANLPRVLDNMNTYLREMRATDLSGSSGVYRLREELLVRVNKTIAPVKVTDVLFKEIIVQ